MERRSFLKSAGLCTALLGANWSFLTEKIIADSKDFELFDSSMSKPIDTKIRIKPICAKRVHKEAYNGPCRYQPLETLTTEAEHEAGILQCNDFVKELSENTPFDGVLLHPEIVEYPEGDVIDDSFWTKLEPEIDDIDLFITTYRVPGLERFKKPVAMIMKGITSVDIAAYYRSLGLEGYAIYDWEDFNNLITLLKVRKAIASTKIIVLTNRLDKVPYGVYSSITDYKHLSEKYGIETEAVPLEEFYSEYKILSENKELKQKLQNMTDSFVNNAAAVHMNTNTIIKDFLFYAAINQLMKKHNANSFSVRCFELCGSKISWNEKFVPCSGLSLLKDQGIPAGCEGDMNVLFAMMMQMYLAKKSVFMGNPLYDKEKNLLSMYHDVPGLKMHGYTTPDLPYEIVNFTESGFGATLRYDFAKDIGQKVTLARFGPQGDNLIMSTGTIDGCFNLRTVGCKLGVHVKLKNAMDMFYNSQNFGHHLAMVYGDYSSDIKRLGKIMNFDVVEC